MDELPAYILDAFAFMAYIQGEPAAQNVKKYCKTRDKTNAMFMFPS